MCGRGMADRFFYSLFFIGCVLYSILLLTSNLSGCGDSHEITCRWSEKHTSCFCREGPRKGYTLTWAPAEVCRK